MTSLSGQVAVVIPADVTSPEQVAAAFAEIGSQLGTPSLVVACAGTAGQLGPVWSADPDECVTVYGNLGDRQTGHVSAFAAAKAGIARLTESLAVELEGTGVLAFSVHPGFVRTPMTEQLAFGPGGRTWLPDFAASAEQRWGSSRQAEQLIEAIARGEAYELAGRVIWAGDDLGELSESCQPDPDLRRLRLKLT
jgi:NAD(P)-dependent dehydrogenase (short-subunit alcohol dehydrogenase family)